MKREALSAHTEDVAGAVVRGTTGLAPLTAANEPEMAPCPKLGRRPLRNDLAIVLANRCAGDFTVTPTQSGPMEGVSREGPVVRYHGQQIARHRVNVKNGVAQGRTRSLPTRVSLQEASFTEVT